MGVPKHYNERMKVENAEYMYECMYEKIDQSQKVGQKIYQS